MAKETILANARFFEDDISKVPTMALTVGVATVMDAKEVLSMLCTVISLQGGGGEIITSNYAVRVGQVSTLRDFINNKWLQLPAADLDNEVRFMSVSKKCL